VLDCNFRIFRSFIGQISIRFPCFAFFRFLTANFAFLGPLLDRSPPDCPGFFFAFFRIWTAIFAFLDLFLDRSLLGCLCFGLQFFFLGELSCTGICLGALCFPPTLLCLLGLCVSIQS
ncbi:hypothetical protein BKA83DRAFT_4631582, partial [Pisolithus microcarpus]